MGKLMLEGSLKYDEIILNISIYYNKNIAF